MLGARAPTPGRGAVFGKQCVPPVTQRSFRHSATAFPAAPRKQGLGTTNKQPWGLASGGTRPSGRLLSWTPQSHRDWGSRSSFCIEKKGPSPSLSAGEPGSLGLRALNSKLASLGLQSGLHPWELWTGAMSLQVRYLSVGAGAGSTKHPCNGLHQP